MDKTIELFKSGVHNILPSEKIPLDGSKDSSNFFTKNGKVVLVHGRKELATIGVAGTTTGIHVGYKVDGTKIIYVKFGTSIKYWDGSAWQNCLTGLTSSAEYVFSNYSSLSGACTIISGVDGLWKVISANPASPIDAFNDAKNFKGYVLVDRGRSLLWNRAKDKTGLYGSWIDRQNSTVYTSVSEEDTASLSGTLAFKAGSSYRNCFAVQITITATSEVYTDTYLGTLTGSAGGTGTINYATGAYTLSNAGVGTANYQWENITVQGILDFSYSATRLAGEGFQFPQDEGGDAILSVEVGQDGTYYSLKSQSAYSLSLDADDVGATNEVYRKDMGLPNFRASVSTNRGIVFINTANPTSPKLTVLQRNVTSLAVEPVELFPQFDFSEYDYTDCSFSSYDDWVLIFCKTEGATNNDRILLCDTAKKTVDIVAYSGKMAVQANNRLYVADSITQTVYETFSGFDDLGLKIDAYWKSKDIQFTPSLNKVRRLRFKGHIDPDQKVDIYISLEGSGYTKVGTIDGSATYVNFNDILSIGSQMIGEDVIGGDVVDTKYGYYMEVKIKTAKFRTLSFQLIPTGIGYFDFDLMTFWGILTFENRIPKLYRTKQ